MIDELFAQAENERKLANVLRYGTIKELDTVNARVKVSMAGATSDWIPWATQRAGAGVKTWSPPRIGEQVLIASPHGDHAQAMVIASLYQNDQAAPSDSEHVTSAVFPDGSSVVFDAETSGLTVTVGSGGMVTINGNVTINGTLDIVGASVTHNSKSIGDTHKHSGVQAGGSNTGNPV